MTASPKIETKDLKILEPSGLINDFNNFCDIDLEGAIKELNAITTDGNRIHLQKLVYVNLVNRFDSLIDKLLLWLSVNNSIIRSQLLNKLTSEFISRKEFFEFFLMKEKTFEYVNAQIQDLCRNEILRGTHVSKINKLAESVDWKNINRPQVGQNGQIYSRHTKTKKCPNSVLGFADWLYSRRNSVVHGDGKSYTKRDFERLKNDYKVEVSNDIRLLLQSIKTAREFYINFLKEFKEKLVISVPNLITE